jgi:4-methyl-5(b-hydroxyethyl)-thiazole monophosphate biosynthesis
MCPKKNELLFLNRLPISSMDTPRSVLVPVSHGCEEIETVSIVDVLRRGGASVTLASIEPPATENNPTPIVHGSNGINILCDTYLTEQIIKANYDMIALPGGLRNAEALGKHRILVACTSKQIS